MPYKYNGVLVDTEDMVRKFAGSWIVIQDYGLVYILAFREETVEFSFGKEIKSIPKEKFEILQEYPEVGVMVNYKKVCGLINRIPKRQWIAGLIESTLSAVNSAGYTFSNEPGLNSALAKALFFPEYPPLEKVYSAVSSDPKVALAFSPVYWMCSPDKKNVLLYRRGVEMGVVSKEKDTYILNLLDYSCSLEQELKDEIKNVKFTIKQSI